MTSLIPSSSALWSSNTKLLVQVGCLAGSRQLSRAIDTAFTDSLATRHIRNYSSPRASSLRYHRAPGNCVSIRRGNSTTPVAAWKPPTEAELETRPVLVLGAGVLGRRLAVMWASTSRPVLLYDESPEVLTSAIQYISDTLGAYCFEQSTHPGHVGTCESLKAACQSQPWMVIEALPEELDVKRSVLAEVEALVADDCILASNSSSFRTAEMLATSDKPGVKDASRLLNTHHYIPPRNRMVELMSSGVTAEAIFPFLSAQMTSVGLRPMTLPLHVQSTGLVFNRIWAAIKRETLAVLEEGVSKPADVDELFRDFFHAEKGPCEKMDEVGLDTIHKVETHYLEEIPELQSASQLKWLEKQYVEKGMLGEKSGNGLFSAEERAELARRRAWEKRKILEESKGA